MRFFTCLIDPEKRPLHDGPSTVSELDRYRYDAFARRRGLEYRWQDFGAVTVLTGWDDPWGDPFVATHGRSIAVGTVRLDNREEVRRWTAREPLVHASGGCETRARVPRAAPLAGPAQSRDAGPLLTDLDLVLRAVVAHGPRCVPMLLGDFAFVVYNGRTYSITAAVDAFSVKTLYYAERGRTLAFSSRAEALALSDDGYDRQYLAERVAMCIPTPGLTAFAGVHAVSAAHMLTVTSDGTPSMRRYWSAHDFETDDSWIRREQEAAETCRDLLADAVRLRLGSEGETWAELSGGLDSSSDGCTTSPKSNTRAAPPSRAGRWRRWSRVGFGGYRGKPQGATWRFRLWPEVREGLE